MKKTIYELRTKLGLSQEDLARRTGLGIKTIFRYENDIQKLRSGSYKNIEKIAKALNVEVKDLKLD